MDESEQKEFMTSPEPSEEKTFLETLQPDDIKRLYEDHQRLLVLYGFANTTSLILDPELLLHETMNVLFGLVKAERGAIFLFDERAQTLTQRLSRSRTTGDQGKEIVLSRTIIDQVFKERKGILTLDAKGDVRFQDSKSIQMENIRSAICVPMESQMRILGVLYIDSRLKEGGLSKEDLTLVSGLANQTAIALENVELVHRLHEERQRIEGILNGLTVGVVSIEEGGVISFLNPKARQILHHGGGELIGRSASSVLEAEDLRPLGELIQKARQSRTAISQQEVTLSYHGAPRVLEVSVVLVRQPGEQRVVALLEDVTEKRELSRQVSRTEKLRAIGEMAAGLIHEINNPLNIIFGRVQLLLMKKREDPEIQKAGEIIRQQVDRASKITDKLLNFAKQRPPEMRAVDPCGLLNDVLSAMENHFSDAKVTFVCHLPQRRCLIHADPSQLEEVFMNLTLNAIQAMPKGGVLTVEGTVQSQQILLSFRDTGVGIPPEYLPKIFIPFFTTKPHGTGLGLPVVHGIVEIHHGTLRVDSEVGRGTTFTVTFPLIREESIDDTNLGSG